MKTKLKYLLASSAALLVAVGAASMARADEAASAATASPATKVQAKKAQTPTWVMGNIIRVKHHRIAINTENGRMRSLRISGKTTIILNGKKANARELKAGAPVMASYFGPKAHPVAIRIEVNEAQPFKAAVAKTAPKEHSLAANSQMKPSEQGAATPTK